MQKIVYNKQSLKCVGVVNEGSTIEWEVENNVIPNFGGVQDDYDVIETDIEKVELVRNESGTVEAKEREFTIYERKEQIIQTLNELDKEVPRIIEDIVSQGNFNLYQDKLDIIAQKQALRQQLQELEV